MGAGATRATAAALESYIEGGLTGLVLDIDGNGEVTSGTDGILLMRYLLDFPTYYPDTWFEGVVGAGATRATAAALEAYLASIMP